jgi:flagellar basal-body rod modification protein FlgD
MAIGSIDSATVAQTSKTAGLRMEDLLTLLMTELTYQDPLKPVDNKDFLTQMAQFSSLETSRQLNDNIVQLLSAQSLSLSVGLIGRTVDAAVDSSTVSGQVTALQLASGQPMLTLTAANGQVFTGISMNQVQNVR